MILSIWILNIINPINNRTCKYRQNIYIMKSKSWCIISQTTHHLHHLNYHGLRSRLFLVNFNSGGGGGIGRLELPYVPFDNITAFSP